MAGGVEEALMRFTETLGDDSVDNESKLKVLRTLGEVSLTLSELSNSGVGRAVRRLKSEPGELGQRARGLVIKWKALLDEHMKRENIQVADLIKRDEKKSLTKDSDPEFLPPPLIQPRACKRPSPPDPVFQSLDASSGLSFEQAMSMTFPVKKKAKKPRPKAPPITDYLDPKSPSRQFTQEVLSSLSVPFDRPDVQQKESVSSRSDISVNSLEDDGDLKFHSKRVIWAPRMKRFKENGAAHGSSSLFCAGSLAEPSTLVEMCLAVLAKNISIVDHVGEVPYEIFSRALQDASPEDLLRIEKCNPQFRGLMDDLWKKHIHRCFPESRNLGGPRHKETWAEMYGRLKREASRRLDQFINRSASKLRAEKESRRITLMTDVITPTQIQRRATRLVNGHGTPRSHHRYGGASSSRVTEAKMVFKPRNMSYPTPPHAASGSSTAFSSSGSRGGDLSSTNRPTSSMLQKLRKQFSKSR